MPHCINAIILKGPYDTALAITYDLYGIDLGSGLTLFHISQVYATYWQYKLGTEGHLEIPDQDYPFIFPAETALAEIARRISNNPEVIFALIKTNYHAGIGDQLAGVYQNEILVSKEWNRINLALKYLGVVCKDGLDEFDSAGLDNIRSEPDFLFEDYADFLEEHGL